MNLNNEQLCAVTHPGGPLLILAGAGSGKTRVLTNRIAHLISEKKIPPDRIMAVTFTNKAAGEMKERVMALTGFPREAFWVSTFHAFSVRMLRRCATRLGYRENFVIFDSNDQLSLVKRCLKELNVSEELISPSSAVNAISRSKDEGVLPANYPKNDFDYWKKQFVKVYEKYQAELMRQNGMDFGDLLVNALKVLNDHADIREYYQNKFLHVLVDEYQDTNNVQYRLVKLLAEKHKNIFVVGDEDQAIYRWRGADIRNILEFKQDYPDAEIIKLEQNYRSTPTILAAAHSVIQRNSSRIGKKLWTDRPDKEKVEILERTDGIDEAKFVAREIVRLTDKGFRFDDMAIFYRTNAQSRAFEESFRNYGIPYVIFGGTKFYERMEIKDIIAYMQFILDQANDTALLRIINTPPRGIGKTTVESMRDSARESGASLWDAVNHAIDSATGEGRSIKNLAAFRSMINSFKKDISDLTLGELTKKIVEETKYIENLDKSKLPDAGDRIDNVEELIRATYEYKELAAVSLPLFLDEVALVSDSDDLGREKGVLPMMTVHLAKGLEYPVVFMVGMEEALFPHSRSLEDAEQLEEERRLCYVGMTRAQDHLIMTYTSRRMLYGREQYNLPSRFIDEIDKKFVEHKKSVRRTDFYSASKYQPSRSTVDSSERSDEFGDAEFDQRPPDEIGITPDGGIRVGTKVKHPIFGTGIVRKTEGSGENQKVMVQLMTGQIKTLIVKYAQLEVIG